MSLETVSELMKTKSVHLKRLRKPWLWWEQTILAQSEQLYLRC